MGPSTLDTDKGHGERKVQSTNVCRLDVILLLCIVHRSIACNSRQMTKRRSRCSISRTHFPNASVPTDARSLL